MKRNKEAGQALIFGVVALGLLLLGFTGLGIDIGYLRYEKRLQQTAADNAALAGAAELGFGAGDVTPAGKHGSSLDGFTDGSNNVTVTINNPPLSGPHSGNSSYVEAYVAKVQPTYFMKALGVNSETVTARAVAYWGSGIANSCVFTLGNAGGKGIQGITVNGTPTLNAPTCGIDDNGTFLTNGNKLDVTAGSIGVVGTDTNHGGGTVTPTPITGIAPVGDPLADISPPCMSCTANTKLNISKNQTVSAGNYKSISITGGNVTFNPGTYVIGSGGLSINGNSTVTGNGVTFYITNGGSVSINGTTNVQFYAPNSGSYAGILFYQDPNDSSAATINGTSSSVFQGALYFPKASLDFSGTGTTTVTCANGTTATGFNGCAAYTIIVSDALTVSGTAIVNLNSDFSGLTGGSPIHTTVLVE